MKKKYTIFAILLLTFVVAISALTILFFNEKKEHIQFGVAANMDYATQIVLSDDLLLKSEIKITDSSLVVTGIYHDGIRLYILITYNNSDENAENITDAGLFKIQSGDHFNIADFLFSAESISVVTGESVNDFLIVFNEIDPNLSGFILMYGQNSKTDMFEVKRNEANMIEPNIVYEEVRLKSIKFGTTSTLINCNINAFIDANSFQFQIENEVFTTYVVNRNENNFSILIPLNLQENTVGTLISNSNNGNIELRVPIKFENRDESSLM